MTPADFATAAVAIAIPGLLVGVGAAIARMGGRLPVHNAVAVHDAFWADEEPVRMLVNGPEPALSPLGYIPEMSPSGYTEPAPIEAAAPVAVPAAPARFDAVAGERWVAEARRCALAIFTARGEVTSADVSAACPIPADVDGRLMSKVFTRREWEVAEYRENTDSRNGWNKRPIVVWRLKSSAAA